MFEIDPKRPETLVNQPNPVPSWFQAELRQIGGTTLDGRPILRAVWGQTETTFACGRTIPKYRTGIVKETKTKLFRLRNTVTNEITDCDYETAKARWELTRQDDFVDDFIRSETHTLIELEPIGIPNFCIEQFMPMEKIKDTPLSWERNRYKLFSPHPLIPETRTDIIGPFPFHGRYEGFFIVKEDDGTRLGKYRPLDRDVLEEVQRRWRARESWKQTKSTESMTRDIFQQAREKELRDEAETAYMLQSAIKPHSFTGAYLYDPPKRNRKGRK